MTLGAQSLSKSGSQSGVLVGAIIAVQIAEFKWRHGMGAYLMHEPPWRTALFWMAAYIYFTKIARH